MTQRVSPGTVFPPQTVIGPCECIACRGCRADTGKLAVAVFVGESHTRTSATQFMMSTGRLAKWLPGKASVAPLSLALFYFTPIRGLAHET